MSSTYRRVFLAVPAAALIALAVPTTAFSHDAAQCGSASWYALTSKTASGEMMNPADMTAAHRTLPFGTRLKVTNPANGRSVVVRINDRGPFIKKRVLDLSRAAADKLGFRNAGLASLCFEQV